MMNLPELIERLQEAHAALGNHPNAQVRFEMAGDRLDDEGGTSLHAIEIEPAHQLVVIRG
jgi:hypothetical protein